MDVFNIGDQILNSVQDAVSSGDFSGLNRTIRNVINSGGDANYWSVDTKSAGNTQAGKTTYTHTTTKSRTTSQSWQTKTAQTAGAGFQAPSAYVTKVPGSTSGVILKAIGYPLAVFNGILMIGSAFVFGIAGMLTAIQRDAAGNIRHPPGKFDPSAVIIGLETPRRGGGEAAAE